MRGLFLSCCNFLFLCIFLCTFGLFFVNVFFVGNVLPHSRFCYSQVAIGMYLTAYDGWRRATAADWMDPAFQVVLVQAHRDSSGWALLEEPLDCDDTLYVAEGRVQIDGAAVVDAESSPQLRGVFPAMNGRTQVAWTTTAPRPAPGDTWKVLPSEVSGFNPPCLFVQVLFFSCVIFFLLKISSSRFYCLNISGEYNFSRCFGDKVRFISSLFSLFSSPFT
jgi:hypothetical protein